MGIDDALVEAYYLALQIISEWGHNLDATECADIAYRGLQGDLMWLEEWEEH